MNEINPYQSPQVAHGKVPRSAGKQGVGVLTILLLTPVAVGVALLISCVAVQVSMGAMIQRWGNSGIQAGVPMLLLPPFATLVGMIIWAVRAFGRRQRPRDAGEERPE